MTVGAPASIAAATSSPTPAVLACSARSPPVRWTPHACALSTYAVSSTSSTVAGVGAPNGPATASTSSSPPSAAYSTSTNPGPPSDIGARSISSSGAVVRQPVGDRLGGLDRGQGAGELVGRHEYPHAGHPRRYPTVAAVEIEIRPMQARDVVRRAGQRRGLLRARHPAAASLGPGPGASYAAAPRRLDLPHPALPAHDAGGCWVAEDDTGVVGIATSFRRETLWCLATYAVVPGRQGQGIGKPLLAAAVDHGRACTRGMLSASADPTAVRLYRQAGFDLHPQMCLTGTVDRSAIPVVEKVREGRAADVDLMDSLDRAARGAGHGPDHELTPRTWRLLVSDTTTGSGYAYLNERGQLGLLAATNRRTAVRLLWAALAEEPSGGPWLTSPPRTSGCSTSGLRPGSTCTRRAIWRCAG